MKTIKGTVKDADGQPAVRTLRFYQRDTGALLGEVESDQDIYPTWDDVVLSAPFRDDFGDVKALDDWDALRVIVQGGWLVTDPAASQGPLRASAPLNSPIALPDGSFTLEATIKCQRMLSYSLFLKADDLELYITDDGRVGIYNDNSYLDESLGDVNTVTANAVTHIAMVYDDGDAVVFVNGSKLGTVNGAAAITSLSTVAVEAGGYLSSNDAIRDVRLTLGKRYTTNFTPQATPYPTDGGAGGGAYEFQTAYEGEVQVVCLADDAAENDLIHVTDTDT